MLLSDRISYDIGDRRYLNLTDRCTLRCAFCPKFNGSRDVHGVDLTLSHPPDVAEALAALGDLRGIAEVVFCGYGEPTLRLPVVVAVGREVRRRGVRVRLNTDGLANRVYGRNVLPELAEAVDALSVSMNAQDEATYRLHCRPKIGHAFESMLAFLAEAPRWIDDVTATAIDGLPGVDIDACERLAASLGVKFRRRVLGVVG